MLHPQKVWIVLKKEQSEESENKAKVAWRKLVRFGEKKKNEKVLNWTIFFPWGGSNIGPIFSGLMIDETHEPLPESPQIGKICKK